MYACLGNIQFLKSAPFLKPSTAKRAIVTSAIVVSGRFLIDSTAEGTAPIAFFINSFFVFKRFLSTFRVFFFQVQ